MTTPEDRLLCVDEFRPDNPRPGYPLMMEFAVNPETAPILVSTTRATTWLNPKANVIRAAVRPIEDEGLFFREVVQAVIDAGVPHKWGNVHPATAEGVKAAIEYVLKNTENAREALTDMPPRSEDELDAVTLHNQVLCRCLHKSLEAPGWS